MNEEIDLDKISNVDLLKYNYIRLPCRCILDRYTEVIVLRVCNLHKNLAIGRKDGEISLCKNCYCMTKSMLKGDVLYCLKCEGIK